MVERFTERAARRGLATDWATVERMVLDEVMPNPSGRVPFPDDVGRFVAWSSANRHGISTVPTSASTAAPPTRHLTRPT